MKKRLLLAAVLLPLASANANITVMGEDFELNQDCVRLNSDRVSISSDGCASKKWDGKDSKNNASIHGGNHPGKGHNKIKKHKKK